MNDRANKSQHLNHTKECRDKYQTNHMGHHRFTLVGGFSAKLTGGDFAQGAFLSLEGFLTNQALHRYSRLPNFDDLWKSYPKEPDYDAARVYDEVGGQPLANRKANPDAWENSCAMRLSRAFNYAGAKIPYIKGQTLKGKDGMNYFFRVNDIERYIVRKYGTFNVHGTTPGDFSKYQGVILFRNCGFSDASGHIDLWNGARTGGSDEFGVCTKVTLLSE